MRHVPTKAEAARSRFATEYPAHERAAEVLQGLLDRYARAHGYRATVVSRPKTIASFVKKSHKLNNDGGLQYPEPWDEIRDKVGARIIVDSLTDLHGLCAAMQASGLEGSPFQDFDDKSQNADPASLYYPGIHAQVIVPGVTTSDGQPIDAEVQLRTKAQDLWASTSHQLVYKGVVAPEPATFRRVMRLSVLVEMFDEEVQRVMTELAADPAYRSAEILHLAEAEYLKFVAEPGEPELSLEVLQLLQDLVPADLTAYARELREFVTNNESKLRAIFTDYGPYSAFAASYANWLFSQPEAVVVFNLIETAPMRLASSLPEELFTPVRNLFAAWGQQMPSVG